MSYKQWTTPDNKVFFPAGEVVGQLPPGYYQMRQSMQGFYFEKQPIKSERLMRFPDAASDYVIEQIEKFWDLEESFRADEIPYKRGILAYGPPGSGKTCTLRIVVDNLIREHEGLVVDFGSTHMFKEGYDILRQVHPTMPLIVLMEDLDAILQRQNESEVLNLLDGMYGIDKTVFLATTNYPEHLGSRIMNRPSRFDKKVFIGMPSCEAREMFIRTKLIDESDDTIKRWVDDTAGMSIAHINELYITTKKFGESYDEAVNVLKKMSSSPHSSSFDPYRIEEETKAVGLGPEDEHSFDPFSVRAEKMYSENRDQFWSKVWKGNRIVETKKRGGKVLTEDVMVSPTGKKQKLAPSIDEIADLMDDDIRQNNGLRLLNA